MVTSAYQAPDRSQMLSGPGSIGGYGGGSVVRRVEALLGEPRSISVAVTAVAVSVLVAGVGLGAFSVQMHHFTVLLGHICRL